MIKSINVKEARDALKKKGFEQSQKRNRDHEFYFFYLEGKKTRLFFKISHGAPEVRRDEIRNSARNMGIAGDDLYRILSCAHDADATTSLFRSALDDG